MATQKKRIPGEKRPVKKEPQPPKKQGPEVVYTQGKPFHRGRFLVHLLTVAAVVLAICAGLSVFFKVDTITVAGLQQYTAWTVEEASGIEKGDNLLFFNRASAASKILKDLPYVASVRFGITLPGTVNIVIEEITVTYAIRGQGGQWWLISSEGKIVKQTDAASARNYTAIEGVELKDPQLSQQAVAAEQDPDAVTVTAADRLNAALQIAKALEANEILGDVTSMDVSNLYDIRLMYGEDYTVKLGDTARLREKLAAVKQAMPSILSHYPPGTLDASFTTDSEGLPFIERDPSGKT